MLLLLGPNAPHSLGQSFKDFYIRKPWTQWNRSQKVFRSRAPAESNQRTGAIGGWTERTSWGRDGWAFGIDA